MCRSDCTATHRVHLHDRNRRTASFFDPDSPAAAHSRRCCFPPLPSHLPHSTSGQPTGSVRTRRLSPALNGATAFSAFPVTSFPVPSARVLLSTGVRSTVVRHTARAALLRGYITGRFALALLPWWMMAFGHAHHRFCGVHAPNRRLPLCCHRDTAH